MSHEELRNKIDRISMDIIIQAKTFKQYATDNKRILRSLIKEVEELRNMMMEGEVHE